MYFIIRLSKSNCRSNNQFYKRYDSHMIIYLKSVNQCNHDVNRIEPHLKYCCQFWLASYLTLLLFIVVIIRAYICQFSLFCYCIWSLHMCMYRFFSISKNFMKSILTSTNTSKIQVTMTMIWQMWIIYARIYICIR